MAADSSPAAGKTVAVYAGTFDPMTNGHLDIISRALKVVEQVHVAVAASTPKQTLFTPEQRLDLVRASVKDASQPGRIVCDVFKGLLVDHVRKIGSKVIIRGLRAVSDYEYEAQMAHINRYLADDIETVFLVTSGELSFVSSSIVKEIARNGGTVQHLVPTAVAQALVVAYQKKS